MQNWLCSIMTTPYFIMYCRTNTFCVRRHATCDMNTYVWQTLKHVWFKALQSKALCDALDTFDELWNVRLAATNVRYVFSVHFFEKRNRCKISITSSYLCIVIHLSRTRHKRTYMWQRNLPKINKRQLEVCTHLKVNNVRKEAFSFSFQVCILNSFRCLWNNPITSMPKTLFNNFFMTSIHIKDFASNMKPNQAANPSSLTWIHVADCRISKMHFNIPKTDGDCLKIK